jgi:nucleoside 2-deoxyribosyltransferase
MSERPIVYLCGGINGLSDADCRDWREVAKDALRHETFLDPMRRDYRGREDQAVNEIVFGDIHDIQQSDVVLVNATRPSWGTAMEIVYACGFRKRIIAFVGAGARVSPWLRYHCTTIVETLDAAIEAIRQL